MIAQNNITQRHFGKLLTSFDNDKIVYNDWRTKYYNRIGEVIIHDIGNNEKMLLFFISDDIWFHTSIIKDIIMNGKDKILYKTLNSTYEFELIENLSLKDKEHFL